MHGCTHDQAAVAREDYTAAKELKAKVDSLKASLRYMGWLCVCMCLCASLCPAIISLQRIPREFVCVFTFFNLAYGSLKTVKSHVLLCSVRVRA
jgi:hypothetical protein